MALKLVLLGLWRCVIKVLGNLVNPSIEPELGTLLGVISNNFFLIFLFKTFFLHRRKVRDEIAVILVLLAANRFKLRVKMIVLHNIVRVVLSIEPND